ncbi:hypothetical protein KP509_02G040200 [Ceratopteris richardii]|nr:hypothetical protein KP509_02G040200 [Ceratopteris richardii]
MLNKTLRALKGEDVLHGELTDTEQPVYSASTMPLSYKANAWHKVHNSKDSQTSANANYERGRKSIRQSPVLHCHPYKSNIDLARHNHSVKFKPLQLLRSTKCLEHDGIVQEAQFFKHSTPNMPDNMTFEVNDQCSWQYEEYVSSDSLSFIHGKKAVKRLEMNFNSSLFPSLGHNTLNEHIAMLLDEKATRSACNKCMSEELIIKNMKGYTLHVRSVMCRGVNRERNGFKTDNFGDFYLGPWQSTRLHVSYLPDSRSGITNGKLQLVTSDGTFYVALRANVPTCIKTLCQCAALIASVKKIILHVCSLALLFVLFVFGRMLKQEGLIMSDESQLPSIYISDKLFHRARKRTMHNFRCIRDTSKQHYFSLVKAIDTVHKATNSILLYISDASTVRWPKVNIITKNDLRIQSISDKSSLASSLVKKRNTPAHSQACSRTPHKSHRERFSIKDRTTLSKKIHIVPQQETVEILDKTALELSATIRLDKDGDNKLKQKKMKNRATSIMPGRNTSISMPSSPVKSAANMPGTALGSRKETLTRPRSTPSSPMTREIGKLVSPLTSVNDRSIDICKMPDEDEGNRSLMKPSDRNVHEPSSDTTSTEMNMVKTATVGNKDKATAVSRTRFGTLTVSAMFPVQQHSSMQDMFVPQNAVNEGIIGSQSRLDLVSTSAIAPQARAPGSPIAPNHVVSPDSTSLSRNLTSPSSSPFKSKNNSGLYMQQVNSEHIHNCWQSGYSENKMHHTKKIFQQGKWCGNVLNQMHDLSHPQKRQEPLHRSDSVVLYDMWGDHFADLGKRLGSYWIGKENPITVKASSLPPLLQTPPFSVFSCNDPFSR